MKLSTEAKIRLKGERKNIIVGKIMSSLNLGERTIEKMIANDSQTVTLPIVVEIIKQETGLTDAEILEKKKRYHYTQKIQFLNQQKQQP